MSENDMVIYFGRLHKILNSSEGSFRKLGLYPVMTYGKEGARKNSTHAILVIRRVITFVLDVYQRSDGIVNVMF